MNTSFRGSPSPAVKDDDSSDDNYEPLHVKRRFYSQKRASGRASSRASSRAPSRAPSRARSPGRAPSKAPSRAPSRARSPGRAPSKAPSRAPSKARSPGLKRPGSPLLRRQSPAAAAQVHAAGAKPKNSIQILSVFNFKGGVGKTSLVQMLARHLSAHNNVLLFDTDPQCSLTNSISETLGKDISMTLFPNEVPMETEKLEHHQHQHQSSAISTISAISATTAPLFSNTPSLSTEKPKLSNPSSRSPPKDFLGKKAGEPRGPAGPAGPVTLYDLLIPIVLEDNYEASMRLVKNFTPVLAKTGHHDDEHASKKVYLVPGDPRLALLTSTLSDKFVSTDFSLGSFRVITFFRWMFTTLAQKCGCAHVLVDMSPSPDALNKMLALNVDIIIPPLFADRYAATCVEGLLTTVLPVWFREFSFLQLSARKFKKAKKIKEEGDVGSEITPLPKLFPFMVSKYTKEEDQDSNEKNKKNGTIDASGSMIISNLQAIVKRFSKTASKRDDQKNVLKSFLVPPESMVVPFVPEVNAGLQKSFYSLSSSLSSFSMSKLSKTDQETVYYIRSRYMDLVDFLLRLM